MAAAWQGAAFAYEMSAEAVDSPHARAFFQAGAALAKIDGGDPAGKAFMADAQKTLKAAPQDRLQATLTASGLAASLVPMIERGVADDVAIVPSTSLRLELALGDPSIDIGDDTVEQTASYRVQQGTRTNPDWTKKKERCDRLREMMNDDDESCERWNNPKNYRCDAGRKHREEMNSCEKDLGRVKKESPAFADKEVRYTAKRFYGTGSGQLDVSGAVSLKKKVVGSVANFSHDAVAVANVAASHGGPVSEKRVRAAYLDEAAADDTASCATKPRPAPPAS